MLAGHFDVVSTDDYGPLQSLATVPERLAERLIEQLRASGAFPWALADLESGCFLPGRGLLDMKSGLGAGLAVLEELAGRDGLEGNVILLACPDEENQSAGMRAAGELLRQVARQHDLELDLVINLDALQDLGDGAEGQMVGLGCIGKHLVTALVVGRSAHACYPFTGLSAAYLASELVVALECAPELADRTGDERAAPLASLILSDLKDAYDVTTPGCAWNVIVQSRTAERTLADFARIAREALKGAAERMGARAAAAGFADWKLADAIPVLDYRALETRAEASPGYAAAKADLIARLAPRSDLTMPGKARALTEVAFEHAGLPGPAVVLGFGGLSYPWVPPLREQGEPALEGLIREAVGRVAAARGVSISFCDYLPIICDASFPGLRDTADYAHATRNNPLWGNLLDWDFEAYPRIPIVNIGPWWRDYHHFRERVNVGYTFETLPELVLRVTEAVLGRDRS